MCADGTLVPSPERSLADRCLEHFSAAATVAGVPRLRMRPALPCVATFEFAQEAASSSLSIADDAKAQNGQNESKATESYADSRTQRNGAVVWQGKTLWLRVGDGDIVELVGERVSAEGYR